MIQPAEAEHEQDPILDAILDLADSRMDERPEQLRPVTVELRHRMRRLSEGVAFDLDEAIKGPVAL
jgi:hypothetical protein